MQELFKRVVPHHCLGSVWSRRADRKGGGKAGEDGAVPQTVYATVEQFNSVSHRVIATILKSPYGLGITERANIIDKWIRVAQVNV